MEHKTHYDLTLRFTVNLAFWQILRQYKLKLAKVVNPNMKKIEQTFPVKLFENVKGPLQMPTALTDIVKKLNDEGSKSKQTESRYTPIFTKYESNILTIVSGGLASVENDHHIDNYGETDSIAVTSNKPWVGELDTTHESFVFD